MWCAKNCAISLWSAFWANTVFNTVIGNTVFEHYYTT